MTNDISFIGLGNMGFWMAANVRKAMPSTSTLFINDINSSVCDRFVSEYDKLGPVKIVGSAKDAASASKTVISVVPAAAHVRVVYLNPTKGVIAATKDTDRLILECSTIDLTTAREVAQKISESERGIYVDSPVSGGVVGAEQGTLSFLVGSPASDALSGRIKTITTLMGPAEKLTFCGKMGTGLAAKIANNYISCNTMLVVAEAFALGMRNGVDAKTLYECIRNSTGHSWVLDNNNPVRGLIPNCPASNNYLPTFKIPMMIKDIGLGVEAATLTGIKASMGEAALVTFEAAAVDPRCVDKDCTSVWIYVNDEE